MSKELEALSPLEALKDIGKLKENGCYVNTTVEYKMVETALKAFEIIKEMGVLSVFQDFKGVYYLVVNNYAVEISKEKYDLLKEVL